MEGFIVGENRTEINSTEEFNKNERGGHVRVWERVKGAGNITPVPSDKAWMEVIKELSILRIAPKKLRGTILGLKLAGWIMH